MFGTSASLTYGPQPQLQSVSLILKKCKLFKIMIKFTLVCANYSEPGLTVRLGISASDLSLDLGYYFVCHCILSSFRFIVIFVLSGPRIFRRLE